MKKDDAQCRFGVSVLRLQIPLSSRRITLDSSDMVSRILSLSTESNAMDPIVTKEIGISKLSSHSAAVSTAEIVFYSIKRGKELSKDS